MQKPSIYASMGFLVVMLAGVLAAQQTAVFRSYTPVQDSLDAYAGRLRTTLSKIEPSAQIYVDSNKKVVLLQGTDKAHRIAQRLQRLRKRGGDETAGWVAQANQPELRSYVNNKYDLTQLASQLKQQYKDRADVQIALDRRTGRILVNAPEKVQKEIESKVRSFTPTTNVPNHQPNATPRTPPNSNTVESKSQIQLKQFSWQELLRSIQGMSERKLAIRQLENGQDLEFSVTSNKGRARFEINPHNGIVSIFGNKRLTEDWAKTIRSLDNTNLNNGTSRLVPLQQATPQSVSRAVFLLQSALRQQQNPNLRRAGAPQDLRNSQNENLVAQAETDAAVQVDQNVEAQVPVVGVEGNLIGPVEIQFVEGLGAIIVKGRKQDVDQILKIIAQLEELTDETQPEIVLHQMKHVSSEAMAELVIELNQQINLQARQGSVGITPLVKPNALLLIGRKEAVASTIKLIEKLDQPVEPQSQFQVFPLKHMPAETASQHIQDFFAERLGLGPRIQVQADFRTNSIIVYASPRDMKEVAYLLSKIDTDSNDSVMQVRVFQLNNASAIELQLLLQQTLKGEGSAQTGTGQAGTTGQQNQQRPGAPVQQGGTAGGTRTGQTSTGGLGSRSSMLILKALDAQSRQIRRSGILTDVRVSADARTNSLVVTAPETSMDLIAALIDQLDRLPAAEAQIDVFTVENGNAQFLFTTLTDLFGQSQIQQPLQSGLPSSMIAGEESNLVPLRFSIDQRSNSIIAIGSARDLGVVETVLTRLDESTLSERQTRVVRLLNAPAQDVTTAITSYLDNERIYSFPFNDQATTQIIEREVVVVPELVSNSLIVSATPRFFNKIIKLISELDARPPMVMIQVVIAEVTLDNAEELGFEFGIQDSLLFDRSVNGVPGFAFNNQALGNDTGATSLATREKTAGQALTNLGLGRTNSDLGYGGLVLSASSESVSILVRALQESGRLDILSRPQVMTLNNQPASILVGQQVPLIGSTSINLGIQTNSIDRVDVGLLLGVTPRISPDGLVVMEIDATRSSLGDIDDGVPVSVDQNGGVVRQPIINTTQARTTVSARSGQTIILGGLITKDRAIRTRRIPILSDVPVVGSLFRFDSERLNRSELLFIMTPYIVNKEEDVDWINQVETSRMSWCLADVVSLHGDAGIVGKLGSNGGFSDAAYPGVQGNLYQPSSPITSDVRLEETQPDTFEEAPTPPDAIQESPSPSDLDLPFFPGPESGSLSREDSGKINVAKWDSVKVRQFENDGTETIELSPPDISTKMSDKESGFTSVWSKIRGRRVKSEKDQGASFISPVKFLRLGSKE